MKRLLAVVVILTLCMLSIVCIAEEERLEDESDMAAGIGAELNEEESVSLEDEAALSGQEYDGGTEDYSTVQGGAPGRVHWTYTLPLTTLQSPCLTLVNGENLLDAAYKPDSLVKVGLSEIEQPSATARYLDETAKTAMMEMFEAAQEVADYPYYNQKGAEKTAEKLQFMLGSAYRSYGQQKTSYSNRLARLGKDDGYVAKPGASEHQTGLCADIITAAYVDVMNQDYQWTPEAQWMKEHCAEFGFILRYPADKEDVTGIMFEPWHFRYVGKEAAGYIMSSGITLEEFTEEWKAALQSFLDKGGSVEEQLAYENSRQNAPLESYVLDEYGIDGDAEVSLIF